MTFKAVSARPAAAASGAAPDCQCSSLEYQLCINFPRTSARRRNRRFCGCRRSLVSWPGYHSVLVVPQSLNSRFSVFGASPSTETALRCAKRWRTSCPLQLAHVQLLTSQNPDGRRPAMQSMSTWLPAPQHGVVVEDVSDSDGGLHTRAHTHLQPTSLPRIWTLRDERGSREAAGVRKPAPSPRA